MPKAKKKIMEKLNRAQKCSILGPSGGPGPPGPPPDPHLVLSRNKLKTFLTTALCLSHEQRMVSCVCYANQIKIDIYFSIAERLTVKAFLLNYVDLFLLFSSNINVIWEQTFFTKLFTRGTCLKRSSGKSTKFFFSC